RSYFAGSCGGAPLEVIKQYIQNQRGLRIPTHGDRSITFMPITQ
ncbi:transposase, partial [Aeromonas caviae]|nr:transposase [Aeromonas caviae]